MINSFQVYCWILYIEIMGNSRVSFVFWIKGCIMPGVDTDKILLTFNPDLAIKYVVEG